MPKRKGIAAKNNSRFNATCKNWLWKVIVKAIISRVQQWYITMRCLSSEWNRAKSKKKKGNRKLTRNTQLTRETQRVMHAALKKLTLL